MNKTEKTETIDSKLVAFATTVGTFLAVNCTGGIAIPRPRLAEAAGLDPKKNANLFSEMIAAGLLPGYKLRPGAAGGVCLVGSTELTVADKDPGFVALLNTTLNCIVPPLGQGSATRSKLAEEMWKSNPAILPNSETENRISACLADKLCPGYSSQRGRGIFRVVIQETEEAVSSDAAEGAVEEVETAASEAAKMEEPASEVQAEAAPVEVQPETTTPEEPKKSAKRSKKSSK